MTATIPTRPLANSSIHGRRRCGSDDDLLRFALRADATLCAALGLAYLQYLGVRRLA